MSKYKTKKIDYTGCDPVIAKHLQRGEAILCTVAMDSLNGKQFVVGYNAEEKDHRYITTISTSWKYAKPIETKQRVKKAFEIVKWLEDNGYTFQIRHTVDMWHKECEPSFTSRMFRYCGGEPHPDHKWHPDWLEEVTE